MPVATRNRVGTCLGTGLAPLRKARPWLAWCGHPVGSAVVQIANASKVAKPPRACRPRPDHDLAMQRAHGAGCNEVVPRPRVANHRLRVCTPGAPRRGCTVHLQQVHPGENGVIVRSLWGHSEIIVGHSEVVFGPVGCCVAGTRPHGPGNQGGPVGTCWARCLRARLGGARSPASPSPTKQTRSIFRARVEALSPAQPHHAQFGGEHASLLGTGGPDATPTAPHMGYRFRIARGGRNRG